MPVSLRNLVFLLVLAAVLPVIVLSASMSKEQENNQAKLARLKKKEPQKWAQLHQRAEAFLALPESQRNKLRKLDQDLRKFPPARRKHLFEVMKRYDNWLAHLPAHQRQQVKNAPTMEERLKVIQNIREQQWLNDQPCSLQEELAPLEEEARKKLIAHWKEKQRFWHVRWQIAINHWDELLKKSRRRPVPMTFDDLSPEVRDYLQNFLFHVITEQEKQSLEKAEGQWPDFPFMLVCLADKYPPALDHGRGPVKIKDFPQEIRTRLMRGNLISRGQLRDYEGRWPDLPIYITGQLSKKRLNLLNEVWPTQTNDLSFPVREFLQKELKPLLSQKEEKRLQDAEGTWPDFPHTIQNLADKYYLQVPWQTLPQPREQWEGYRVGYNPFLSKEGDKQLK